METAKALASRKAKIRVIPACRDRRLHKRASDRDPPLGWMHLHLDVTAVTGSWRRHEAVPEDV